MKRLIYLALILSIFNSYQVRSQDSSENWDTYIASYEDGIPGTTTLRMDLINVAPIENLKYVLVTGITYETNREDGFPEEASYSFLHKFGDEILELLKKETETILVGSFMHNKERLEYFYIKEPKDIKEKIENYFQTNFPDKKFYLNIKEDVKWEYYKNFLYPNEEILNFMADQSVIKNLLKAGDDLTKKRRVDHWLYFDSEADRDKCKEKLLSNKFKIESVNFNKEVSPSYELQIWRIDFVDLNSFYPLRTELTKIAEEFNGEYDGWETSIVK